MEQVFCQSCAMPMNNADDHGTNTDKSTSDEYCTYCFQEGKFTQDVTMDGMINHCVQYLDEFNKDSETQFSKEQAIAEMKAFFPNLKRWAKA